MNHSDITPATAIVIGASGQDGYFLTQRLLEENWTVHAVVRKAESLTPLMSYPGAGARLKVHAAELTSAESLFDLIARERPEEIYNLAGQSASRVLLPILF